jgi:hypothetical protein
MKDTFYFQHDYEPTADPKIQALLHKFGGIGYGLWWRIIEMLHSDEQHKIQHKKYIILAIAGQMSTSVEQVQEFLNFCINDVELLISDSEYFWSERVNRNIDKRNNISLKRSFAGKKSAEQRNISSTSVEQVLTNVEQNPTKKRKEKKRKEDKILINKIFFKDSIIFDKNKFEEKFPEWNKTKLAYYYESALNYSNEGNKYIDWVATIRNWAKRDELQGRLKFENKTSELKVGEVFQPKINFY